MLQFKKLQHTDCEIRMHQEYKYKLSNSLSLAETKPANWLFELRSFSSSWQDQSSYWVLAPCLYAATINQSQKRSINTQNCSEQQLLLWNTSFFSAPIPRIRQPAGTKTKRTSGQTLLTFSSSQNENGKTATIVRGSACKKFIRLANSLQPERVPWAKMATVPILGHRQNCQHLLNRPRKKSTRKKKFKNSEISKRNKCVFKCGENFKNSWQTVVIATKMTQKMEEQIVGTQEKSQQIVAQRLLSCLQYLEATKSSAKDLSYIAN